MGIGGLGMNGPFMGAEIIILISSCISGVGVLY